MAPDALTFITSPIADADHPSADRRLVCDSPEQPQTPGNRFVPSCRYEMYKSASAKTDVRMLGGTSADLLWDRKKGYITVCDSAGSMDTGNFAGTDDGDSGGLNLTTDLA